MDNGNKHTQQNTQTYTNEEEKNQYTDDAQKKQTEKREKDE